MPGRIIEMSSSPVQDDTSAAPPRASGRVRKQTNIYAPETFAAGKRKRSTLDHGTEEREMPEDYESDDDVPSNDDDDEADQEELRSKTRRPRKPAGDQRPTQKKAKLNGAALPIRSVRSGNPIKRAPRKKTVPSNLDIAQAEGLFAKVFGGRDSVEDVAGRWIQDFKHHESRALADVINFVLQSAGCRIKVEAEDVEDADGVSSRLKDIQDEFQATQPTDYPLNARGRTAEPFKATMTGFLRALIKSIAATNLLYENTALIENIEEWFSVMSSAADRAFRHTSTVASLAVVSALCEIGQENAQEAAARQRQVQTERSKARPNKSRVKDMEQRASESSKYVTFVEAQVRDWFMVVFVHRYRDVDHNIRRDCIAALGEWIMSFPEVFFDAEHLRYSGWLLCDISPTTRAEVLKQLQNLYKQQSMIGGLQAFTERFRERLVEITTSDAESNVRCLGVELLTLLRENGLLEPDDIDAVGRLLYDADPKVRKAVAGFFAENVRDLYNSKMDDLGGIESIEEATSEGNESNSDTARPSWLLFKCLAEMMVANDPDETFATRLEAGGDSLSIQIGPDSRLSLAANALYKHIGEIQDWQDLSSYLLFDHSVSSASTRAEDAISQLKQECVLNDTEEMVLLHVLDSVVRRTIADLGDKIAAATKLTKHQREQLVDRQEEAARTLANLVPKLLKKFGDSPAAAAAVLKMEAVLNAPSIKDLPRSSKNFISILDDIRKLFMSHGTDNVLSLARDAMVHARSNGELNDIAEERLAGVWEDVVGNLIENANPETVVIRGASDKEDLLAINASLLRIVLLSQKANCIGALEDEAVIDPNASSNVESRSAIDHILGFIQRAMPSSSTLSDAAPAALEDQVASRAAEAASLYLQWKFFQIKSTVTSSTEPDMAYADLEALATRRDTFFNNLLGVLRRRNAGDSICVTFAKLLLELSTSAKTLLNLDTRPGASKDYELLAVDLQESTPKLIMSVFSATERNFARLSRKRLEKTRSSEEVEAELDINADPVDDDDDDDDDDDAHAGRDDEVGLEGGVNGAEDSQSKESRLLQTLLAERALCELTKSIVFAVHGGYLDATATRRRLERNRSHLGPNFKELLAYLDIEKVARTAAGKAGKSKAKPGARGAAKTNGTGVAAKGKAGPKSNAIVADDEVDDEIEDDEDENDEDADEETLERRALVAGEGEEARGLDEGFANATDADEQSVLGD